MRSLLASARFIPFRPTLPSPLLLILGGHRWVLPVALRTPFRTHRHTRTPVPALRNTRHAADTRVLVTTLLTQVLHAKHGATQSTAQCAR